MSDIEINLIGFEELERKLKDFTYRIAKNIVARSVYAGAVVVRTAARNLCPVKTGKLKKSIRIRSSRVPRGSYQVIYQVGTRLRYANMVERGTKAHLISAKKTKALTIREKLLERVKHPGARARPFMRPAFDNNIRQIIEAMREKLAAGINAEYLKR